MRLSSRSLFVSAFPSRAPSPADAAQAAYREPRFSRALLYSLLALLIGAQVAFEGVRLGPAAPDDALAMPLLQSLRGANFGGDPFRFVLHACASPLWWLLARLGEAVPQFALFSGVLFLARLTSALAVFRLAERAFGHSLGALITAALWLGSGALGLHHNFLAPADVALALWLWAAVLWHEERPAWALLCGLATGVDVLPSFFVFALFWATLWLRPPATSPGPPRARVRPTWRQLRRGAENRLTTGTHALAWFALGAVPAWISYAPRFPRGASPMTLLHFLAAPSWPQEASRAAWPLIIFLMAGAWCWRASLGAASTRALSFAAIMLGVATAPTNWLFGVQPHDNAVIAGLARLAPLAATLGLLAIAHICERSAARRGSSGWLGFFVLAALAIVARAPLLLVLGILFIEGTGRLARQPPGQNARVFSSQSVSRFARRDKFSLFLACAGRWAFLGFVLLLCARARLAVGARLQNGGAVFSAKQSAQWQSAQRWTKVHTPRDSVILAGAPGFRAFGGRAVFLDPSDEKLTGLSPQFARAWRSRYPLAAPLWNLKVRLNKGVLSKLRAGGVTHIVARSGDARLANWQPLLQAIHRNIEWTIYRVR